MDRPATRQNLSAGLASVSVALILVALKLWAVVETRSLSIAASLADSSLDLLVSLGRLAAILYAARPPDEDHAFGHTSVEDLTALGQSTFILMSAALIAWNGFGRLFGPKSHDLAAQEGGIAVMLVSIVLTIGLVLWQRRVVRQTGSKVVAADSVHYIGDLIPNIGAIVSLWVSARYGLGQVDSIVAIAAAAVMAFGAIRIGRDAWNALMDRRADPALIDAIAAITRDCPGVRGFHDLKTRTSGSRVFVNLHIELDGDQPLREAHAISAALKRRIIETYPQTDVIIHKDVADEAEQPRS
ncbi:cation diffusion facilitator family transporter [Haematobacter massiliensis]|uniref:cation diffusion facilitator family transporter n=1 Tax=Haematobacter massiliensis TaxID=195105 RepID=UPI00103BBFD3|nr:cation diffusion facilitator family transporter [Haematobacter massiliensis]QBJ23789.1 cation diffusion facilitator family transporter [Haematobacter massiliensis]